MKFIKGFALLSFLLIATGSCFDPPEFPLAPQIEFEKVDFIKSTGPGVPDSLILYLNFKDGNGDLGFSKDVEDISDPFHSSFFYQGNNGKLEPLSTVGVFVGNDQFDLLEIPDPSRGKLVSFRSRKNPEYSFLPQTFHCADYEYLGGPVDPSNSSDGRRLLIEKRALAALDPNVQLVDSMLGSDGKIGYYQIRDTLYYTPNPDHYNIEVEFLVKDPTAPGGFKPYDWRREYCSTFDGRFPVFSDKGSSIEGTLRYGMTSFGFTSIFSIKTLKLRVSIKDHERNRSNVIETPEFRL